MTTLIDDIFQTGIMDKLNTISVANGYVNDVSVLDGFFLHYAKDLLDGDNGLSFPCVAAQMGKDTVTDKQNKEGTVGRVIHIIGAIDVNDRALVNSKLNSLVFDVRKALSIDKYNSNDRKSTKAKVVELGGTDFDLPKNHDQYAYFDMTITIEYVEKWK